MQQNIKGQWQAAAQRGTTAAREKLFNSACILHVCLINTPACNGKIISVTLMPVNLETSAYSLTVGKSCCDEESTDVVQSAPPKIQHLLFGGGLLSE